MVQKVYRAFQDLGAIWAVAGTGQESVYSLVAAVSDRDPSIDPSEALIALQNASNRGDRFARERLSLMLKKNGHRFIGPSGNGWLWATDKDWTQAGLPRANAHDPYLPQTNTMTEEEERALLARAQEAHDAYVAQTQAEA